MRHACACSTCTGTRVQADLLLDAERPLVPQLVRVLTRRRETEDTWTLELDPGQAAVFAPGQFTMMYAFGTGEAAISISGDPDEPERLVHTVRALGPTTHAICAAEPGDVIGVRGPFGRPWPVDEAEGRDVVIVAGGIGLAPLRPALLHVLSRRERYGRVTLLYGGREPEQLLFREQLAGWRAREDLDVGVTVDMARGGWRGRVGVVPALVPGARLDPGNTTAMICGPEVMMRASASALTDRGVPASSIHVSMERNMQCGFGRCGHCQLGPTLICRDGPVYPLDVIDRWLGVREL